MFAAFVQSSLIRLIPVGMVMLALQRTVFAELRLSGVVIQVVLALVAAAGASGGSERGAVAGFVLGSMYDLVEGTPLGFQLLLIGDNFRATLLQFRESVLQRLRCGRRLQQNLQGVRITSTECTARAGGTRGKRRLHSTPRFVRADP